MNTKMRKDIDGDYFATLIEKYSVADSVNLILYIDTMKTIHHILLE